MQELMWQCLGQDPSSAEMKLHETITDFLQYFFTVDGLKYPNLSNININIESLVSKSDLTSIAEAVKCGRLPQLKKLDLAWNYLTDFLKHLDWNKRTDYLKHLLGDPEVRFTSLEELGLNSGYTCAADFTADLHVLAEAVKCGRLPQLKKLNLGWSKRTDCLKHLLGDPDVRFTSLEELYLDYTSLSAADLQVLAEAVKCGRLPQLKKLNLSWNNLTDSLKHLLEDPDIRFTSLEELYLDYTSLSAADLQVLAEAVKCGRLPQLKKLKLWGNTLTDCLKHLLGDPDVRFTSLEELDLDDTDLSAADLQVLKEAIECWRLPQLEKLDLPFELDYFW